MTEKAFTKQLGKYLPEASIPLIYGWLEDHHIRLRIAKPRSSKLGDFRIANRTQPARISVNGNLNPYSFLITLTHEIAHLKDFENRQSLKEAHGAPWKKIYGSMLERLMEADAFPASIVPAVQRHARSPQTASCADVELLNALRQFDAHVSTLVRELNTGDAFELSNGRRFVLGELRRTRYKCRCLDSNKWYLIHGAAEVRRLEANKS